VSNSRFIFHLLTHSRELKRPTNSGAVVLNTLGQQCVRQIQWERDNPDNEILSLSRRGSAILIYHDPLTGGGAQREDLSGIEDFILLDGTWQEARKIYNKSPYLQGMESFVLSAGSGSLYNIRRNQTAGGLCTAECVIEILKLKQDTERADMLHEEFLVFLKRMISRVVYRESSRSSSG